MNVSFLPKIIESHIKKKNQKLRTWRAALPVWTGTHLALWPGALRLVFAVSQSSLFSRAKLVCVQANSGLLHQTVALEPGRSRQS